MKILFISSANQPDYQCDVVYHGLKMIYGSGVESVNDMWFMYDDLIADEQKYLYGLGFTLYGNLPSNFRNLQSPDVVRNNIKNKLYDLIVYGSIQRDRSYLNVVLSNYQREKIVFIDGEDWLKIDLKLSKAGIYFKRELDKPIDGVFPIGFGFPENKIKKTYQQKVKQWSFNKPGNLSTYIYKTEDSYYLNYQQSKFALTTKKAGWDCLRHYEIIANGALPYFPDLDECPVNTLTLYPKERQLELNKKIKDKVIFTDDEYNAEVNFFTSYLEKHLTTVAVVKYLLNCVKEFKSNKPSLGISNLDDIQIGTDKIDLLIKKINNFSPKNILYYGIGSVQTIRYFDNSKYAIMAIDSFESVENSLRREVLNFEKLNSDQLFDCIVLDGTLTYSNNIGDTLRDVRKKLNSEGKLIVLIPNFKIIWNYLAIFKNKLNFNRLELSKSAPINLFSIESIKKTLKDFNLEVNSVDLFGSQNNNLIKEKLNKIGFFDKYLRTHILITAIKPNEND
jgi:hypothetical protein